MEDGEMEGAGVLVFTKKVKHKIPWSYDGITLGRGGLSSQRPTGSKISKGVAAVS